MEKEVVWTSTAQKDFWNNIAYLSENWLVEVLQQFEFNLDIKIQLISKLPNIGFSSKKYSRFRKTLVGKQILLIYAVTKTHIVIHRMKHTSMK
jgi:plasmid stabilization system protein ParE